MREIIARIVCGITVSVVLSLAVLFAWRHNPVSPARRAGRPVTASAPDDLAQRGQMIYAAQDCATCHAIAGHGNPRRPLDGVGAHRGSGELRAYITATGDAAGNLPAAVVRRKNKYRDLPEDDIAALVHYLATLRDTP